MCDAIPRYRVTQKIALNCNSYAGNWGRDNVPLGRQLLISVTLLLNIT